MFTNFQGKKVLFITTKPVDYIRNSQEIRHIQKNCTAMDIIHSHSKNYFTRIIRVYFQILTTNFNKYDAIFIGFAPQLVLPFFYQKIKKSGASIIIDFFISLYDTFCLDRCLVKPNSIIGKYFHHLDCRTLKLADHIICDTNAHGQFFIQEFHADPLRLHTIYLEADRKIYHPIAVQRPKEFIGKYVVLYFGTGLPLQGTDTVLEALAQLGTCNDIISIFIGHILNKKQQQIVDTTHNLIHINWLPQDELNTYINYADLCLAGHFNPTIAKAKHTIPGKAYIYDAVKKPMILGDTPANRELFDESNPRYLFVPLGDSITLANTIQQSLKQR